MSNPWTPGPWEISPARGMGGEYWVVGGEGKAFGLVAEVTTLEDATLIVSALALVEALEACLGLLTGNMDGDLPADRDPVEMARAALSLAKGTQGETR